MSAGMAIAVIFALLAVVGLLLHGRRSRALGRAEAGTKAVGEILNNVSKSNQARRRLRNDPDRAKRLRDRFTRRE